MSDSMETGDLVKNPAIDKINRINTAKIRMSAVTDRTGAGTAGGILTDGGRKTVQALPVERRPEFILENCSGVQVTAQDTGQKMETVQIRSAAEAVCRMTRELFPRYKLSGVSGRGEPLSGRMVSDGNARNRDRTYQSIEYGKGTYDTADVHVSGQGIRKVEEYHSREFQNTERERRQSRWNELVKRM